MSPSASTDSQGDVRLCSSLTLPQVSVARRSAGGAAFEYSDGAGSRPDLASTSVTRLLSSPAGVSAPEYGYVNAAGGGLKCPGRTCPSPASRRVFSGSSLERPPTNLPSSIAKDFLGELMKYYRPVFIRDALSPLCPHRSWFLPF